MDQRIISSLEEELSATIAVLLSSKSLQRLPLHPDSQTVHLMAKAAVAVYEAAVENRRQ